MVCTSSLTWALFALAGTASARVHNKALDRRFNSNTIRNGRVQKRDTDPNLLYPTYNLSVPVDHFHNDSKYAPHSDDTFALRYWFDATYYKEGGPVIVLQSGEDDGTDRLPFLQKGLLHEMIEATNGLGVVLEHRYYGGSWPTANLTTKSLRFLTTDQALADEAYFAQHIVFPGLEHLNLTAPNVAYIGYGGSYAGAFNAILRKLYPDVFWGTISSSGVVEAIWDYWTYFSPIIMFADQKCVQNTQKITNMVDNIIIGLNDNATTAELKTAFGLPNVTYNDDFAEALANTVYGWQSKNWDPALNSPAFDEYCGNVTASKIIYPSTKSLKSTAHRLLKKGGYGSELSNLTIPMLNYIGWVAENIIGDCQGDQDSCFGTHSPSHYTGDTIDSGNWKSWPYQYCTEWGFLQTGSGTPAGQLPLISRLIDLPYSSLVCKLAFNLTEPANVDIINKYGGFSISYPRLAMIDGEQDPWRPATAHASPFNATAQNRTNTVDQPFILIEGAVHHWDENGLFPNETVNTAGHLLPPQTIRTVQAQEITFVKAWMQEWAQTYHK